MLKLTVVAGPNRGSSYPIHSGENSIGRQANNNVVLQSSKVSKRHCVLVVDNTGGIEVQDQGSSNGTYVNGVLAKVPRKIRPGDKISVGEWVFEISAPPAVVRQAPPIAGLGANVLQFPNSGASRKASFPVPSLPGAVPSGDPLASASDFSQPAAPKDLKGRALFAFEKYVMPFFYGMTMKSEWRLVFAGIIGVMVILNVIATVSPLLEVNRLSVIEEVGRRARFMAQQIAEANAPFIASRNENRADIGSVASSDHVRVAVLTDMDNRIIAPSSKINQHLASGTEARIAVQAAEKFRAGRETGIVVLEADGSTLVAVEPIKVLNPQLGKNVAIGMAVVSIDTSLVTLAAGEMGTVYSKALITSGLLALVVLMITYRMTLKPFQILNEDMDRVLKGDMAQVTHEFKIEELNQLWDIINAALQRIPKTTGPGAETGGGGPSPEDYIGPVATLAVAGKIGMVVLDAERKVLQLNASFEEVSGIRPDVALGQDLGSVARDQSLGPFVNDLLDRSQAGVEGPSENFDFSGVSCKVHVAAFGRSGESPKCYVLAVVKNDGTE